MRKQTYSAPLSLSKDDDMLDWLTLSRAVAEKTYANLKIYFQIRRLLFLNIYAFSRISGLIAKGLEITANFLHMLRWLTTTYIELGICPKSGSLETKRTGKICLALKPLRISMRQSVNSLCGER